MIIKVITISRAKASGIKLVEEPTDAAIDIRADYVAKYGWLDRQFDLAVPARRDRFIPRS